MAFVPMAFEGTQILHSRSTTTAQTTSREGEYEEAYLTYFLIIRE